MVEPAMQTALAPLGRLFDELQIAHCLVGSVASSIFGRARSTMDADIVAEVGLSHAGPICDALAPSYYVDAEAIREAVRATSSFNVIHLGTMIKVDVFISKGRPYDKQMLSHRKAHSLDATSGAVVFSVAAPEDVLLGKLQWFRSGGDVSQQQWGDALGILEVVGERLDLQYLRRWGSALGVSDLVDQALRDAEL